MHALLYRPCPETASSTPCATRTGQFARWSACAEANGPSPVHTPPIAVSRPATYQTRRPPPGQFGTNGQNDATTRGSGASPTRVCAIPHGETLFPAKKTSPPPPLNTRDTHFIAVQYTAEAYDQTTTRPQETKEHTHDTPRGNRGMRCKPLAGPPPISGPARRSPSPSLGLMRSPFGPRVLRFFAARCPLPQLPAPQLAPRLVALRPARPRLHVPPEKPPGPPQPSPPPPAQRHVPRSANRKRATPALIGAPPHPPNCPASPPRLPDDQTPNPKQASSPLTHPHPQHSFPTRSPALSPPASLPLPPPSLIPLALPSPPYPGPSPASSSLPPSSLVPARLPLAMEVIAPRAPPLAGPPHGPQHHHPPPPSHPSHPSHPSTPQQPERVLPTSHLKGPPDGALPTSHVGMYTLYSTIGEGAFGK